MLISELGEEGLIEKLKAIFSDDNSEDILVGIGDDAAVVLAPGEGEHVWTTDTLIESIHFRKEWQTPLELGRKCLLVNISDLSAMGARPRYALLSIAAPPESDAEFIINLCRGIKEVASGSGISVVGGDSTASPRGLLVNIALMGTIAGRAVTRSGASPGDVILVTGDLGGPAAGLRLLDSGRSDDFPGPVAAFVRPPQRNQTAIAAAGCGVTAMTDISDGLAAEIRHICRASGTGARIEASRLPLAAETKAACAEFGWNEAELALDGGEEYELLVTVPGELEQQLSEAIAAVNGPEVTAIGEITPPDEGIVVIDREGKASRLESRGYQHFRD